MTIGGLLDFMFLRGERESSNTFAFTAITRRSAALWLAVFVALLIGLPIIALYSPNGFWAVIDAFYRAGALVFGGGHVVLPLLQAEVVTSGWVSREVFVAGYGATQAVPGPLFTFAAFLGAFIPIFQNAWLGGLVTLVAIFLPSFFLIAGALPFWSDLRRLPKSQSILDGINAAVVGILLAALYDPVWISAIGTPFDFIFSLVALVALMSGRIPAWAVVIACGALGSVILK